MPGGSAAASMPGLYYCALVRRRLSACCRRWGLSYTRSTSPAQGPNKTTSPAFSRARPGATSASSTTSRSITSTSRLSAS
eukprot:11116707-Alexandrium_andersonii.AAC.1